MPTKSRVLWVEDSARFDLQHMLGPIFASRRYDLTLAENATSGADYLRQRNFDAVVVDVRLPPGTHPYWRAIYNNAGADRTNAKLGLPLLGWLLDRIDALRRAGIDIADHETPPRRPKWDVSPQQIGVFSVENRGEIGPALELLGVDFLQEKRPGLPDSVLIDIVDELLG